MPFFIILTFYVVKPRSQNCEKRRLASSCQAVRLSKWNNSATTVQNFYKIFLHLSFFFENLSRKFKFRWNLKRLTGTVHEDRYIFLIISRTIHLRIKKFQTKVVEKIKTHILCSVTFFETRSVYEEMWKNVVERGRLRIIWRMRIECWIPKATNIHSQYTTLIAFPLQQRLLVDASILRYTYIACLVFIYLWSRKAMWNCHIPRLQFSFTTMLQHTGRF
jgi:hypothetical protein